MPQPQPHAHCSPLQVPYTPNFSTSTCVLLLGVPIVFFLHACEPSIDSLFSSACALYVFTPLAGNMETSCCSRLFTPFDEVITNSNSNSQARPRAVTAGPSQSSSHNATLRDLLRPFCPCSSSDSPPSCRAIMGSSWSRFSSSTRSSKSSEDLRASVLWEAKATTPDFNPPLFERVCLGSDQEKLETLEKKRGAVRGKPRRAESDTRSWATVSEDQGEGEGEGGIEFKKQPIKRAMTISLLTASFEEGAPVRSRSRETPIAFFAKSYPRQVLSSSMLPSAFDSDSEAEDDEA